MCACQWPLRKRTRPADQCWRLPAGALQRQTRGRRAVGAPDVSCARNCGRARCRSRGAKRWDRTVCSRRSRTFWSPCVLLADWGRSCLRRHTPPPPNVPERVRRSLDISLGLDDGGRSGPSGGGEVANLPLDFPLQRRLCVDPTHRECLRGRINATDVEEAHAIVDRISANRACGRG